MASIAELDLTKNALRAKITDYIRLMLGDQMVDIELDPEHYNLAIDQAIIKYRQRSQNAHEESYAFLDLLEETQSYTLPSDVVSVRQIFRRGIGSVTGTSASQFEPFASGYLNTYMLVAGRVGGLVNYELFSQYQELAMKMFGGFMNYTFNPVTKSLTVIRKIPKVTATSDDSTLAVAETVLLWIYNYKPEINLLSDHMIYPWIQDYAYALSKKMVGEAREKFGQIAGPQGGTSLNGAALKGEAQAAMDQLEKDLQNYVDGSQPITWVIG